MVLVDVAHFLRHSEIKMRKCVMYDSSAIFKCSQKLRISENLLTVSKIILAIIIVNNYKEI